MNSWRASDIPDLTGSTAIVTGANAGLGFVTATELARHGAAVVLAVRNVEAGADAAQRIRSALPRARLAVHHLDLASLASVRAFAAGVLERGEVVDLLVNNAGAQSLGPRRTTADGYEFHLGTNVLGHFALTGLLLPALTRAAAARVVSLSSITHKRAHLDFDDLQAVRRFSAVRAYGASKLAATVFGLELDRRLRRTGSAIVSALAHPGLARSNFIDTAWSGRGRLGTAMGRLFAALAMQPTEQGALPTPRAATGPATGGAFFGPGGAGERRGDVVAVRPSREAADPAVGARFWSAAEDLTGVRYLD
ncbi:MAG: oxidoreductase [Leifsonia sp.]|uniref:oxidoreductase n=1 Tax=Leifsonia sp. TaxID=1870902 RepID=UPI003F7F4F1B